jgi:hypothetical protein
VWIVYLIRAPRPTGARRLGRLMAFCVLGIQLSTRTVDTFLTTFTALHAPRGGAHRQGRGGVESDVATGVALGLAIACKITALAS